MNYSEKRNILYRLIASTLILIALGMETFALIKAFSYKVEDKVLTIIGLILAMAFTVFEIIVILLGWKKQNNLQKIVFNENERVNNFALLAVIIGTLFGIGLFILSLVVYLTRDAASTKNAMLVILSVSVYLLVNCIAYFIYIPMFKKRPLNLKELIK